jgi:hypothetical protein
MSKVQPRESGRRSPSLKGSRKPGAAGPKDEVSSPSSRLGAPANRKGVLAGHEDDIARLYDGGKGRRVSSIARTYKVSSNAIKKCLALPRRAASKKQFDRYSPRFSKCVGCWEPIKVAGMATRGWCDACAQRAFETITIYDRDKGIGEVPTNLLRYAEE